MREWKERKNYLKFFYGKLVEYLENETNKIEGRIKTIQNEINVWNKNDDEEATKKTNFKTLIEKSS